MKPAVSWPNQIAFEQKCTQDKKQKNNGRGREIEFYSSFIFSIDIRLNNKLKTYISGGRYNELTSKWNSLKFKKFENWYENCNRLWP